VSAVALATRILSSLCVSAPIFIFERKPPHASPDHANRHSKSTSDMRRRVMRGLFLGVACTGRDEVAVLILLQLRAAGQLSAEGSVLA
jgi:hypothetical protein